jgi:hypothetical protein
MRLSSLQPASPGCKTLVRLCISSCACIAGFAHQEQGFLVQTPSDVSQESARLLHMCLHSASRVEVFSVVCVHACRLHDFTLVQVTGGVSSACTQPEEADEAC